MDCKTWLKNELSNGIPVLCDTVRNNAKEQGFSKKQLREARAILGVRTFHQIDDDSSVNWFWYLEKRQTDD